MTFPTDTPAPGHLLTVDLAIVGAGPVGLALAGWLAQRSATRTLTVALIDARDASISTSGGTADPRAIALSQGSRMLLEPLAWPSDAAGMATEAGTIKQIHISQRGHFGRALIDHREHNLPALGYVVRYGRLVERLSIAAKATPVQWLTQTTALAPIQDAQGVTLPLSDAEGMMHLRARLVIHAEGGLYQPPQAGAHGNTRADALQTRRAPTPTVNQSSSPPPRPLRTRDYQQTAVVGTVRVASPRPNMAWERFTSEGPLALLPLGGAQHELALVWCGHPAASQARLSLSDAAFLDALQQAFGSRLGRFTEIGPRASFPLGLNALQQVVDGRTAAIGNAAQTLHPVAGQGLNLGLRDAYALVDALAQHGATPEALKDFAARRAGDRRLTIASTDTLARAFTADFAPLGALRGLALAALDFVPPAKTWLARQMMFGQRR